MNFSAMIQRFAGATVIAFAVLFGTAAMTPSHAVAVSCPGTAATNDREFTLTTNPGSTCLLFHQGGPSSGSNISGNPSNDPFLNSTVGEDFSLLSKSDGSDGLFPGLLTISGQGSTSGTFSFTLPPIDNWLFAIGFKSGNGQLNPDWAIFELPVGVTSGSWSISGNQALSHVNLYGTEINVIPVPAALPLAATGLTLFGLMGWRKRAKAA